MRERGSLRSSLLYYFKVDRGEEVGYLQEIFPVGCYVCTDCANIVKEYKTEGEMAVCGEPPPKLSRGARLPTRARPAIPLAMSTPGDQGWKRKINQSPIAVLAIIIIVAVAEVVVVVASCSSSSSSSMQ